MNVTICLCTCQRPALLERLLEKLSTFEWRGLDRHNIHLLVVDNAPLNANRVLVDAFKEGGAAPINASYHEEWQRGLVHARNTAFRIALESGADLIATLDDDDIPQEDWLLRLIEKQRETSVDIVYGTLHAHSSTRVIKQENDRGFGLPPFHTSIANMLITEKLLHMIGKGKGEGEGQFFDSRFNLIGREDTDFCIVALKAGATIASCPQSIVYFYREPSRLSSLALFRRGVAKGYATMEITRKHGTFASLCVLPVKTALKALLILATLPVAMSTEALRMRTCFRLGKLVGVMQGFLRIDPQAYYGG